MQQPNLKFLLRLLKNTLQKIYTSKLRVGALLLISITLASLLSTIYLVSSSLLLANIKLSEEKNTRQSVNEVLQDYNKIADEIYYVNLTWAK